MTAITQNSISVEFGWPDFIPATLPNKLPAINCPRHDGRRARAGVAKLSPRLYSSEPDKTRQIPLKMPRACGRCARRAPRLYRHVDRAGGTGIDCCPRCYRWMAIAPSPTSTPAQESARSRWQELFVRKRPRTRSGGVHRAIIQKPTPPRISSANFANAEGRAIL